jgi:hypothetical protein
MPHPDQEGNVAGLRVLGRLIDISDWCAGFFGALTLVLEHERTRLKPPGTIEADARTAAQQIAVGAGGVLSAMGLPQVDTTVSTSGLGRPGRARAVFRVGECERRHPMPITGLESKANSALSELEVAIT